MAGLGWSITAGVAFVFAPQSTPIHRASLLLAAAAAIQLRLLCNLLDGMLAVEQRLGTKTGAIFNDMPDRIADVVILVSAGYSVKTIAYGAPLGWAAAAVALFTAYVRVLAGSLGATQHFVGPMAKPHRMFTLTVATLVSVVEALLDVPLRAIYIGLTVIVAGSIATAVRRTRRLADEVNAR
jgi:phosphatidylglycerophosphate synthase